MLYYSTLYMFVFEVELPVGDNAVVTLCLASREQKWVSV